MRQGKIPLRVNRVVFSIDHLYREHVEPVLIDMMAEYPTIFTQHTSNQIYQEFVRQSVDSYHYRLEMYEPQVRIPNVHLFLCGDMIRQNTSLYQDVCQAYHEFSIGLYLQLHTNQIVKPWIDIVFHHLEHSHLVLKIVEYPEMDYVNEL